MMTIKFTIEQPINYFRHTRQEVSDLIEDVLEGYNYTITEKTEDMVRFISPGPKPIYKHEAGDYISKGQFEFIGACAEFCVSSHLRCI